jgi:hypothetical protein
MSPRHVILAPLLSLTLMACEQRASNGRASAAARDSAGITIVENPTAA